MSNETIALLHVDKDGQRRCSEFLVKEMGVDPSKVARNMHLTVYASKWALYGLSDVEEEVSIVLRTEETRFMVMTPGGEKPRACINPRDYKVGIRVQKSSRISQDIDRLRSRMISHERDVEYRSDDRTTLRRNQFGRVFQPHVTLLFPGHEFTSLYDLGDQFRNRIPSLTFDRFSIKLRGSSRPPIVWE